MDGPGAPPAGAGAAGPVPAGPGPPDRAAGSRPAGRDLRSAAPDPGDLRIIIPVVHGLAASATILLALLTVVTAR